MNIECPYCHYKADSSEFDLSLSDEAWCPKCGTDFLVEIPDDEDDAD